MDSDKNDKESIDMDSMQRMIKQLTNEIIDLKKSKGEGKKPFKPFIKKRTNIDTPPQIPPSLGINLEEYSMDNFCHTHHANHNEKTCPEFINSFLAMLLPSEPPKKDKKDEKEEDDEEEEEKEEEEVEPSSNLNLIWDETKINDVDDDATENDYNLRSKGAPTSNDSTSTLKMVTKKTPIKTNSTSKETFVEKYSTMTKNNTKDSTANKSTTSMYISQKILSDLKLDYDVVEDLKKMKENITVFELCKITQLREQLHEALQNIQGSQDAMVVNKKVTPQGKNAKAKKMTKTSSVTNTSEDDKVKTTDDKKKGDLRADGALIRKKSRSQTPPFLLTFKIFNHNGYNYLVDSGASSNVIPYSVCKSLNAEPQI